MLHATRALLTLAMLLVAGACGGRGPSAAGDSGSAAPPRSRSTLITFEEMRQRGQTSNLYDLIQDLRPRWLRSRGPDTLLGQQGQVQVHMDGNWIGNVEALRRLAAAGVTSIEWLSPLDASARYGLDHSHGAIVVSTAPIH